MHYEAGLGRWLDHEVLHSSRHDVAGFIQADHAVGAGGGYGRKSSLGCDLGGFVLVLGSSLLSLLLGRHGLGSFSLPHTSALMLLPWSRPALN